jgi:hypothetical protein
MSTSKPTQQGGTQAPAPQQQQGQQGGSPQQQSGTVFRDWASI